MEAVNEDGVSVHMDGTPDIGGKNLGFRPMQMLLAAAGGCSTIDIIDILRKQRQDLNDIKVEVTGERVSKGNYTEFSTIHLHYTLSGDLNEKKVARAIELSLSKYCSVTKTLEKTAKISCSFDIVN